MHTTHTPAESLRSRAVMFMILTTLLWGGSFVFNKLGFREVHPVAFAFSRFVLASLVMALLCLGRYHRLNRDILHKGFLVGLALSAANLSFVFGLNETSVSRAGFLNNLFVLFVPLLGFLIWRERISRILVGGIFLAVTGLWLLAQGGTEGFSRGDFLSIFCAFCIALHILAVSKVLKDEDVYLVTLIQFLTVTGISGILALLLAPLPAHVGSTTLLALAYCALFPTVLCFTLQNTWQRHTTPAQAGLIYTLDPVWSMIGGMVVLGERLTTMEWLGCVLIFSAVLVPVTLSRLVERRTLAGYRRDD